MFKNYSLVLQHYDLASTTVTGIPMKEEQNASSSANYDVEIFHPVAAHADILKLKVNRIKKDWFLLVKKLSKKSINTQMFTAKL